MNYLLIEPKVRAIAPNLALMKWARWCELNGHEYRYVRGIIDKNKLGDFIPDKGMMSCIFSYNSQTYEKTIDYYLDEYPEMNTLTIGGVFPTLQPKWFQKHTKWMGNWYIPSERVKLHFGLCDEIEHLTPKFNFFENGKFFSEDENPYNLNKIILYASRGCINKCPFCAVPKLEGSLKSYETIKHHLEQGIKDLPKADGIFIYDNNFTAHEYFDNIIDEIKELDLPVDFRQGLEADVVTKHQMDRFAELKWCQYIRFAFDKIKYKKGITNAYQLYCNSNVKAQFFSYMLYNWTDDYDDFWGRIDIAQDLVDSNCGRTIYLFPMKFEPLDALKRNDYDNNPKSIGKKWTKELTLGINKIATCTAGGFLPVTKSRNIYNWIGKSAEASSEENKTELKRKALKAYKMNGTIDPRKI